jgi:hypothetical protein
MLLLLFVAVVVVPNAVIESVVVEAADVAAAPTVFDAALYAVTPTV